MGKSYYYAVGADRQGPVDETELDALVANGTLSPETLVWTEGMANWQPYSEVRGAGPAPALAVADAPPSQRSYAPSAAAYAPVGVAMDYASFGQRFLAKIIDALFLFLVGMGLGMILGSSMNEQAVNMIGNVLGLLYNIILHARTGQTLGKMAMKIRVVQPDGGKISVGQAIGRAFAEILSSCILLIGYIMAAFDDEKRALHDRLAGTRVIRL